MSLLAAESLISIGECIQARWDHIPPALKTKLDEFEAYVLSLMSCRILGLMCTILNDRILLDVLKIVQRQASSSFIINIFAASKRDFEITMVESRLKDSRDSITVSR